MDCSCNAVGVTITDLPVARLNTCFKTLIFNVFDIIMYEFSIHVNDL